jgi:hypothetical protein
MGKLVGWSDRHQYALADASPAPPEFRANNANRRRIAIFSTVFLVGCALRTIRSDPARFARNGRTARLTFGRLPYLASSSEEGIDLVRSMKTGIGQPVRRREDFRLLTGKGCYSDDFSFPGQAYAVMVRSLHAHARIHSIDATAAEAASGVLAVLTGRGMLEDGLQAIPHSVGTRHPADITLENKDGSPPFIPPHFPMATERHRSQRRRRTGRRGL